jgi:hypothetical protein
MTCPTLTDVGCEIGQAIGNTVGSTVSGPVGTAVYSGFMNGVASDVNKALIWLLKNTSTLWLTMPSPGLSGNSAITSVQNLILPITAAIAVGGAIAAGFRMALTRRGGPLLDLMTGLAVMGIVGALGLLAATVLLKAGDAWTTWVLQKSSGGQFEARMQQILSGGNGSTPADVTIILGIIGILVSLVQAALLLFRQAALMVLAGVLPLAAAGAIAPATRTWVRKLAAWLLALTGYKPAAAAVYATAFTLIGKGNSLRDVLTGFVMIILSLLALPVLMKFFTWTVGSVSSSGGGLGQFFGMAAAGAMAVGALGSGGGTASAAAGQAKYLDQNKPGGPGGPGSPGGPGTPGANAPVPSASPGGGNSLAIPDGGNGRPPGHGGKGKAGDPPVTPAAKPSGDSGASPGGDPSAQAKPGADSSSPAGTGNAKRGAEKAAGNPVGGKGTGGIREPGSSGQGEPGGGTSGTSGTASQPGSGLGAGGRTAAPSGSAAPSPSAAAGAASKSAAGAPFAALMAGQALATGAQNAISNAIEEGNGK